MRSISTLIFGLLLSVVLARNTISVPENARELYEEFKQTYRKNYANEDDEERFNIFKQNLVRMKLMQLEEQGTAEYGVTKFADLTEHEFLTLFAHNHMKAPSDMDRLEEIRIPNKVEKHVDWRQKGAVNPVEDQGHCGSCWAFSVTGNIEGQWFLKKGKLLVLSKQQLVDCDTADNGCNGGYPPETYHQIIEMGGMEPQQYYPYKAMDQTCRMDTGKFAVYINSSLVLSRDEAKQAAWLAENGPLATALNANQLQHYIRGIMRPRYCNPRGLNHAVLTVGYGEENGAPYWLVKNSWGTDFGEDGYFRIYRGAGTCGINALSTSSVVN